MTAQTPEPRYAESADADTLEPQSGSDTGIDTQDEFGSLSTEPQQNTTTTLHQRFTIAYDFPVCFTRGLFYTDNPLLCDTLARPNPSRRHKFLVFVDSGVHASLPELIRHIVEYANVHRTQLELAGDPLVYPGGETIKSSPEHVEQMQKVLVERHIDRHSYVVGIGGGAFLDAVGLVAATAHRGIRHVRVPTTVLAQNDSGVGVKNGINLHDQKNWFGTFSPPFAVLNDALFIETLPEREKIAGMSEAVKVALIRDRTFFDWLEHNAVALRAFDPDAMAHLIKRCAELHMKQIGQGGDPFETGSARPLDYGHWSAHKIETLSGYTLRHGEAVAIGLALDTRYSVLCGKLADGEDVRVCSLLEALGFGLWHPTLNVPDRHGMPQVLQGLIDFREHLGGELTITLLDAIGQGVEVHSMDATLVQSSIHWLSERHDASVTRAL